MQSDKTRITKLEEEGKLMIKIMDKLEQRIATLEKVLQSHAKCIGELREEDVKTWTRTPIHGDETIWVSSGKGQY